MSDEKKKQEKMLMFVGGALLVGALTYWFFSRPNESEEEQDGNKKENEKIEIDDMKTEETDNYNNNGTILEEEPLEIDNTQPEKAPDIDFERKDEEIIDQTKTDNTEDNADDAVEAVDAIQENQSEPLADAEEPANEPSKPSDPKAEVCCPPTADDSEKADINAIALQKNMESYKAIKQKVLKLHKFKYKNGKVGVKVIKATNLDNKDKNEKGDGWSDPYVMLTMDGNKTQRTAVKMDTANPVWDESFEFIAKDTLSAQLHCTVFDKDKYSADDKIGTVTFSVLDVAKANGSLAAVFPVVGSKTGGKLYLQFTYTE